MKTILGLEGFGFEESLEWKEEFKAWLFTLTLRHSGQEFPYARLFEDDPRTLPESILDFYRDDILDVFLPQTAKKVQAGFSWRAKKAAEKKD